MKGLKEFLVFLHENEDVMAEVEKVQNDTAKVVKIAKKHGYEFTENEYEALMLGAVAGGSFWEDFGEGLKIGFVEPLKTIVNVTATTKDPIAGLVSGVMHAGTNIVGGISELAKD